MGYDDEPRRGMRATVLRSLRAVGALLAQGAGRFWTLTAAAVRSFFTHHGTQLAAAISYYTLLSMLPAAIVLVAGFGLFFDDTKARADVVDAILGLLPLKEDEGRSDIEGVIHGVTKNAEALGIVALIGLLFTASALVGSIRTAVSIVFGEQSPRPPLASKGLDILFVFGLGPLLALSLAATLARAFAVELGQSFGVPGEALNWILGVSSVLVPLLVSAAVYAVLYVVLPQRKVRLRDVWPGVAFAAIVYELAKRGFGLYLESFANYNAVYGSLGAVVAFLVFVYLGAIVLLVGAEMAALWPRVRAGEFDSTGGPRAPLPRRVLGLLRSLVVRDRDDGA